MGNDMFNDEQLKYAEIVQKETEDALGFWKERAEKYEAALREIAKGEHGEYCGERNWLLTAGGKTKCFADCPVNIARRALAETKEARP